MTDFEQDHAYVLAAGYRPTYAFDANAVERVYHEYQNGAGETILIIADAQGGSRVFRQLEVEEVRDLRFQSN